MRAEADERIDYCASLPFLGIHIACLLAIWTGISRVAVAVCLGMYATRMFAITAGYHRYFSHRQSKVRTRIELATANYVRRNARGFMSCRSAKDFFLEQTKSPSEFVMMRWVPCKGLWRRLPQHIL